MPAWAVILVCAGALLLGLLVAAAAYSYWLYQRMKDWGQS